MFPVEIRSGTVLDTAILYPSPNSQVPIHPPITGPCHVLFRDKQLGVYDSSTGRLTTTYKLSDDGLAYLAVNDR